MRNERGFVYFHADSRGGSTLIVADSRARADEVYVVGFGAAEMQAEFDTECGFRAWASVFCDGDFVAEALLYYPDDVDPPEDDIDNEDIGFAVVAGPHKAHEWRLHHGMLACPCEVCLSCDGWFAHGDGCSDGSLVIREGECCERPISLDDGRDLAGIRDGQAVAIEWVPRGRSPVWFAAGWRHPAFNGDGWSLIVEREP